MADPVRLTDADYIYDFAQSPDHRSVAYTSRYGASDDQEGCLELLSISNTGETTNETLFCDADNKIPAKLNWWAPLRIDDRSIIFTALADGDRRSKELYRYDRASGEVEKIASDSGGAWVGVMRDWEDETRFIYAIDKKLFLHDMTRGTSTQLHEFANSYRTAIYEDGDQRFLVTTTKDVSKTTLEVFRLEGDRLLKTDGLVIDMNVGFEFAEDDTVVLYKVSADTLIDYERITLDRSGRIMRSSFVKGLAELNDRLAQCSVSEVSYSFTDTHGGSDTEIEVDAFLFEPRDPVAEQDRLYVIEAFYGGGNWFSRGYHSMCAVGITVLSPVVRGDDRFGAEFETLNDGKNADAPIRDVIAGARYLQAKYALADSRRIGTMGFSHGGWAAVRALSYPGSEPFRFGFALAGAGVFDLLQLADRVPEGQTNIRGWFSKEFGDLDSERERLAYYSATSHLDRIKEPIFLYHGSNDERITDLHSVSFAERLKEAGKAHELLIIEEQGHSIRGARNWHRIYAAMFQFLETVDDRLD